MSNTQRLRRSAIAIGRPGHPPSVEARALAAAPALSELPTGLWHVSDYVSARMATGRTEVRSVCHLRSSERFQLLYVDGAIVGVNPATEAGRRLMDWADPTRWARRQDWARVP